MYLFQLGLFRSAVASDASLGKPFEFLLFDQKKISRVQILCRRVTDYFGVSVRARGADGSQVNLLKETLFSISSKTLANDHYGKNFELRNAKYAEEWNETNVYSNILEDVELSSYFKKNKASIYIYIINCNWGVGGDNDIENDIDIDDDDHF